jgi:hypothetical protein
VRHGLREDWANPDWPKTAPNPQGISNRKKKFIMFDKQPKFLQFISPVDFHY